MRSALHVLCRTSCFLALKLHVLLVGFFSLVCRVFIWLQLLNNVRWGVLALLYVIRKPENMVVLECMFCSELWVRQDIFQWYTSTWAAYGLLPHNKCCKVTYTSLLILNVYQVVVCILSGIIQLSFLECSWLMLSCFFPALEVHDLDCLVPYVTVYIE